MWQQRQPQQIQVEEKENLKQKKKNERKFIFRAHWGLVVHWSLLYERESAEA